MFVLQALLRQKQSELKGLEKREMAIFYAARARLKASQAKTHKLDGNINNNYTDKNMSPDVRPKGTPSTVQLLSQLTIDGDTSLSEADQSIEPT